MTEVLVVYYEGTQDELLLSKWGLSINAKIFAKMLEQAGIKKYTFCPLKDNKKQLWEIMQKPPKKMVFCAGLDTAKVLISKKIKSIKDNIGKVFNVKYVNHNFYVFPSLHTIGLAGKWNNDKLVQVLKRINNENSTMD